MQKSSLLVVEEVEDGIVPVAVALVVMLKLQLLLYLADQNQ
jgi:hypothetical protein